MAAGRPAAAVGTSAPGIIVTLVLWLLAGELFGDYLSGFAYTYVTYYAGLASVMIALVFLYLTASIFIYGAELNTVICKWREERTRVEPAPRLLRHDYSAATAASAMNCDSYFFRRFTFSRYIASNSASGNECVEGRFISASAQAFSRGNFSIMAERLDAVEEDIALQERRIGGIDQRIFRAVEERPGCPASPARFSSRSNAAGIFATAAL